MVRLVIWDTTAPIMTSLWCHNHSIRPVDEFCFTLCMNADVSWHFIDVHIVPGSPFTALIGNPMLIRCYLLKMRKHVFPVTCPSQLRAQRYCQLSSEVVNAARVPLALFGLQGRSHYTTHFSLTTSNKLLYWKLRVVAMPTFSSALVRVMAWCR